MTVSVERSLELLVGARERGVVPVEAAAAFRSADEQRDEHAAVDRAALVSGFSLMGVGEDPRSRLAQQIADGVLDVGPLEEPLGTRLDEATDERAVLVECRPVDEPCSSKAKGRLAPSSSSRVKTAKAPRQKRRSVS